MPRVNIPGVGVVNFPDDMAPDAISASAQKLAKDAQTPLTREHQRGASKTPAADQMARDNFRAIDESQRPGPRDSDFIEHAPEAAGIAAGVLTGGASLPVQLAATGAAGTGGALIKQQADQGLHLPTAADAIAAPIEGAKQAAYQLGGRIASGASRLVGQGLSRAAAAAASPTGQAVRQGLLDYILKPASLGAVIGNPMKAAGAAGLAGAAHVATSPRVLAGASDLATRLGAGQGQIPATLLRAALLQRLDETSQPGTAQP